MRRGDDWVVSGEKMWITSGCIADVAIVWAQTEDGIRGFLLEKGMRGYTTVTIENKWSLKASVTSELLFDEVVVPESNRLPEAAGLGAPLSCLNQARYGIAWGGVGAAMAVYECALEHSKNRKQFDRPIGSFQLVQQKLVTMVSDITKGQLLCVQLDGLPG